MIWFINNNFSGFQGGSGNRQLCLGNRMSFFKDVTTNLMQTWKWTTKAVLSSFKEVHYSTIFQMGMYFSTKNL